MSVSLKEGNPPSFYCWEVTTDQHKKSSKSLSLITHRVSTHVTPGFTPGLHIEFAPMLHQGLHQGLHQTAVQYPALARLTACSHLRLHNLQQAVVRGNAAAAIGSPWLLLLMLPPPKPPVLQQLYLPRLLSCYGCRSLQLPLSISSPSVLVVLVAAVHCWGAAVDCWLCDAAAEAGLAAAVAACTTALFHSCCG